MRACIRLELIGDDTHSRLRMFDVVIGKRPYVAKLIGLDDKWGFRRIFKRGEKDYSLANSVGSRDVYVYYSLAPGMYEVFEQVSWRKTRTRYIIVDEFGEIQTISKDEAIQCLKAGSNP